MRPISATAAVAAVLLLGVTACAEGQGRSGTVYNTSFTIGYDPASIYGASARGPLLVESYGSPGGSAAPEAVTQATVGGLRQYGPAWFPRNYTASTEDAGRGPYHLRFAYNVPKSFDRQELCADTMSAERLEQARDKGQTSTRTLASFCRGTSTLGMAEGAPSSGSEVGSDGFARFVGHMARELMPSRNPEQDRDCRFRFCD